MPAVFPNSVRVYTAKTDLVDTVLAEHVNLLQDEVTAVQNALGTGLLSSSWSGTFTTSGTHLSVSTRLANIEAGVLSRAPIASPTLTGVPAAPTASADTNSTQIATTAFVLGQAGTTTPQTDGTAAVGTSLRYARQDHRHGSDTSRAPLASPTFTGTVTLPLSTAGFVKTTSGGVLSSTSTVAQSEVTNLTSDLALKAPLASPALTGTPTAPTAAVDTNTTQLATTSFVVGQAGTTTPQVNGIASAGTSLRYARQDHVHGTDTTRAPLASPTFTGTVTLPLSTAGFVRTTSGGVLSSTSAVAQSEVTNLVSDLAAKAPLTSPIFGGTPTAPTPLSTDSSTRIATTAWVAGQGYVKSDGSVSNAATATKLATARTITLSGDVTGSTSFDGSANVTITTVSQQADSYVAAFLLGGM